jgi:hypothetical protein
MEKIMKCFKLVSVAMLFLIICLSSVTNQNILSAEKEKEQVFPILIVKPVLPMDQENPVIIVRYYNPGKKKMRLDAEDPVGKFYEDIEVFVDGTKVKRIYENNTVEDILPFSVIINLAPKKAYDLKVPLKHVFKMPKFWKKLKVRPIANLQGDSGTLIYERFQEEEEDEPTKFRISKARETLEGNREALEARLIKIIKGSNKTPGKKAARALGKIGTLKSVAPLIDEIENWFEDYDEPKIERAKDGSTPPPPCVTALINLGQVALLPVINEALDLDIPTKTKTNLSYPTKKNWAKGKITKIDALIYVLRNTEEQKILKLLLLGKYHTETDKETKAKIARIYKRVFEKIIAEKKK